MRHLSMNKAFVVEPDQTADYCPRCGSKGLPVGRETIEAYLPEGKTPTVCRSGELLPAQCNVVYFDAFERVMLAGELNRPVYPSYSRCLDLCVFRADAAGCRGRRPRRRCHARQGDHREGQVGRGPLRTDGGRWAALHCRGAEVLFPMPAREMKMSNHIMEIAPYWLEEAGTWVFDDPGGAASRAVREPAHRR